MYPVPCSTSTRVPGACSSFVTGPGLLLGLAWGARALLRRFPSRLGWIVGFSGALLIGLSIQILHLGWLIVDDLFLSGWSPC